MNSRYEKSPDSERQTSYIMIPTYSEQANSDGTYDIIGHRKEYIR